MALDEGDVDVDWTLNDGILEIECDDGSKLIVNRHLPNREIWVAARSGGFHFAARDGAWRDTRSGAELGASLSNLLRAQAGLEVALPALATPPLANPAPPTTRRAPAAPRRGRDGALRRAPRSAAND